MTAKKKTTRKKTTRKTLPKSRPDDCVRLGQDGARRVEHDRARVASRDERRSDAAGQTFYTATELEREAFVAARAADPRATRIRWELRLTNAGGADRVSLVVRFRAGAEPRETTVAL